MKKYVPTILTLLRLVGIAPLLLLLYSSSENRFVYTAVLLVFVVSTDILDGFLARRWHVTSDLGGFLDPLCDKILIYTLLFALFGFNVYLPYVIFPMFLRDSLVDGLRSYKISQKNVVPANLAGKAKFLFQVFSAFAGLLFLHSSARTFLDFQLTANLLLAMAFLISLLGLSQLGKEAHL